MGKPALDYLSIKNKKIVVVMPAYNAAKTITKTYNETIDQGIVDTVIIVDDVSNDETTAIANTLKAKNVKTIVHPHEKNLGYGGNQKTCYNLALQENADIVIMVHPDYQYTPKLIPAMAGMIINGLYDCVLASRILGKGALRGGMPLWKYIVNRILTKTQNFIMGAYLSEYHTGYRAFSKELLNNINFNNNADGFIFDNELLSQIVWNNYSIGEISCPTHYFPDASTINMRNSIKYGFGCFRVAMTYRLAKMKLLKPKLFKK